jgi:hypothetical protein
MPRTFYYTRFALAGVMLSLYGGIATAGEALRVLSLSAAQASAIQAPASAIAKQPVWRTTFGSERKTTDKPPTSALGVEADVVLLQDVTNLLAIRRAFPPKSWRIVVSRQMVLSDDPLDPRSSEAVSRNPATAVAIRFQAGIRMAGQDHLQQLAARPALTAAAKLAGAPELSAAPLVAATAVRLNLGGRFVWLASVVLDESCAIPGPVCPQRARLNTWIEDRHKMGEAVIVGGLLRESTGMGTECAAQLITVFPARDGLQASTALASNRGDLGCAASVDAGG